MLNFCKTIILLDGDNCLRYFYIQNREGKKIKIIQIKPSIAAALIGQITKNTRSL